MIKKKLIIFDIDGVLFDSSKNMEKAWKIVCLKYKLKIPFRKYKSYIGYPFQNILIKLGINKKLNSIENDYKIISKKFLNIIKPYKDVVETINLLRKMNIKIGICTSKDSKRTKLLLKKNKLFFDYIECSKKSVQGKPNPVQLNNILRSSGITKSKSVYVGDMEVDRMTANNAGIDFVFAKWGYGEKKKYKYKVNSIKGIIKIV